jgi:hypothetical protein
LLFKLPESARDGRGAADRVTHRSAWRPIHLDFSTRRLANASLIPSVRSVDNDAGLGENHACGSPEAHA